MNKSYLILLVFFSLLGCSSSKKVDDNRYYFNTNIAPNKVKEFSISKEFKERSKQKSGDREGRRGGRGERGDRNPKNEQTGSEKGSKFYMQLEVALEKELAIRNYCTSGYTEIERYSNQGFYSIHGKCNELKE
jgi:hypothetical protein